MHVAQIGKWLAQVIYVKPYVFLRKLLLMAGDVEINPGPTQGKEMTNAAFIVCTESASQ